MAVTSATIRANEIAPKTGAREEGAAPVKASGVAPEGLSVILVRESMEREEYLLVLDPFIVTGVPVLAVGDPVDVPLLGATAVLGPATCGTVTAERPAGQLEHGAFTTVVGGGDAVIALAAASRAAWKPDALARLAIEGMADGGAMSLAVFWKQVEQATVTVWAGLCVAVMVGASPTGASLRDSQVRQIAAAYEALPPLACWAPPGI